MVSKRIFPDVSVPIWTRPREMAVAHDRARREEGFGGERMLWFVSQRPVWLRRERARWWMGYEGKSGGERAGEGREGRAKCVAMNPKNGMKRRLNEKRAKARQWMQGLECVALKSQDKDKGGSEGRINAQIVLGIFGMCTSSDIQHLSCFYRERERESRSGDGLERDRWRKEKKKCGTKREFRGQKGGDGVVKHKWITGDTQTHNHTTTHTQFNPSLLSRSTFASS